MANLSELLTGEKKEQVVEDCCSLIDAEVKDKGGISGLAIKAGYGAVKGVKPGFVRTVVTDLLPEFAKALEPVWQDAKKDSQARRALLRGEHEPRRRRAPRDHRREGAARQERGREGDVREAPREREEERRGRGAAPRRDGAEVRSVRKTARPRSARRGPHGAWRGSSRSPRARSPSPPRALPLPPPAARVVVRGRRERRRPRRVGDVPRGDGGDVLARSGGDPLRRGCCDEHREQGEHRPGRRDLDDPRVRAPDAPSTTASTSTPLRAPSTTWTAPSPPRLHRGPAVRLAPSPDRARRRDHIPLPRSRRGRAPASPPASARSPNAPDTYGADADDLDTAPYSVFGPFRTRTLARADATIELAILPGAARPRRRRDRSLGRHLRARHRGLLRPLPRPALPPSRRAARRSPQRDGRGAHPLERRVEHPPRRQRRDDRRRDPARLGPHPRDDAPRAADPARATQHWLEEGLATYVEPIARAKVGTIPAERGVARAHRRAPERRARCRGTRGSIGRTRGGAPTGAARSSRSWRTSRSASAPGTSGRSKTRCARNPRSGGDGERRDGRSRRRFARGTRRSGAPVLEEMHAKWGTTPVTVDLPQIWGELGVREEGDGRSIVFDERAPLAETRRAMTARESPDASP